MEEILRSVFPDLKSMDDVTVEMFHKVMMVKGHALMEKMPKDWTFGGLERGADGRFNDVELADLIKTCTEEPAHAFGANGTPASLRVVDLMGQLQARDKFNVCTLNEFRRYLNLKPYETFEDWCSDKVTAKKAELLYGHIENMELYPGLMAECTKPAMRKYMYMMCIFRHILTWYIHFSQLAVVCAQVKLPDEEFSTMRWPSSVVIDT